MNWIPFKECNRKLQNTPPTAQAAFYPGTFFTDGTNNVYCYRPTFMERLSILFFGRVWLTMKLGKDNAPPMMLAGKRTMFEDTGKSAEISMVAKSSCKYCHGSGTIGKVSGNDVICKCLRPKDEVIKQGHKIQG